MTEFVAYIGTCNVRGSEGIYAVGVDTQRGALRRISTAPSTNSGYLAVAPQADFLYCTYENMVFDGRANGGVGAYRLDRDTGAISFLNRQPTGGQLPCFISLRPDGKEAYVSSYLTGSLSIHAIAPDGSIEAPRKVIQHEPMGDVVPGVHCARPTPDGRYLCVVDVKLHRLVFYDIAGGRFDVADMHQLPPPYTVRPRQIVFRGDVMYLLTEVTNEVYAYRYDPNAGRFLTEMQRIAIYPSDRDLPRSFSACIKVAPGGGTLACSLRGYDLITTFAASGEGLLSRPVYNRPTGVFPRDFAFTPDGTHILAGGQKSDTLELLRLEQDGRLVPVCRDFPVPATFCVAFAA